MRLSLLSLLATSASAIHVEVVKDGGKDFSPLMYGAMFEDINHSGDGGLYAELIQNRAFQSGEQFPATLDPWTAFGGAKIRLSKPKPQLSDALPNAVAVTGGGGKEVGISNPGFWGIDILPQTYTGSFYVKGDYSGKFTAALRSNTTGKVFASASIKSKSVAHSWTKHEYKIVSKKDHGPGAVFTLTFKPTGYSQTLDFGLISLFPPTWNDRPNGLRIDLMEAVLQLNPKFLRFPGGNNLQGNFTGNQWKWNLTIGDLTKRPGRFGDWEYYNTDGLGLIEYMLWAEDLNAAPVLGIWDGLYHSTELLTEEELKPFVQDALNELDFLMGDASTEWGKKRIDLGYEKPFKLDFVEIGNEDNSKGGLPSYNAYRWSMFYDAIHEAWPHLQIVASTISLEDPGENTVLDYHQYPTPDGAANQFFFWDDIDPKYPYLVGEYAVKVTNNIEGSQDRPVPWWIGAIGEAIFYMGTERNCDKVLGTAYAPSFQNIDSWLWGPDLISFNADHSATLRSTSWYVFNLFSNNLVSKVLPVKNSGDAAMYNPAFWTAGVNDDTETYVWKGAVYNTSSEIPFNVKFPAGSWGSKANLTVLTAKDGDGYAQNEVGKPNVVNTNVTILDVSGDGFDFTLPQWSVAVLSTCGRGGKLCQEGSYGKA